MPIKKLTLDRIEFEFVYGLKFWFESDYSCTALDEMLVKFSSLIKFLHAHFLDKSNIEAQPLFRVKNCFSIQVAFFRGISLRRKSYMRTHWLSTAKILWVNSSIFLLLVTSSTIFLFILCIWSWNRLINDYEASC